MDCIPCIPGDEVGKSWLHSSDPWRISLSTGDSSWSSLFVLSDLLKGFDTGLRFLLVFFNMLSVLSPTLASRTSSTGWLFVCVISEFSSIGFFFTISLDFIVTGCPGSFAGLFVKKGSELGTRTGGLRGSDLPFDFCLFAFSSPDQGLLFSEGILNKHLKVCIAVHFSLNKIKRVQQRIKNLNLVSSVTFCHNTLDTNLPTSGHTRPS